MCAQEKSKTDQKSLDNLIHTAAKKVGAKKENDICRYIPIPTGGYIHHFTMRKMRTEAPEQLYTMITKYIINSDKPVSVPPKQRAARGSRKRRDQFVFTKQDLDQLLQLARLSNNKEMVRKLTPRKDLRTVKRELIASIRHTRVDQDLWQSYSEAVNLMQQATAPAGMPA